VGDSTAGKSRAAFEAIRANVPDHVFLCPATRAGVGALLPALQHERAAVVWLDDLERYLGESGLHAQVLASLLGHNYCRVLVLATMRAHEHARYSPRHQSQVDPAVRDVLRRGAEVLELAHEIRLERRWTPTELNRARHLANDDRIAAALKHADRFGVA